jgi:hypothetical protein
MSHLGNVIDTIESGLTNPGPKFIMLLVHARVYSTKVPAYPVASLELLSCWYSVGFVHRMTCIELEEEAVTRFPRLAGTELRWK